MKILITGARGYLASFLIPKLSINHELILTSHHAENENPEQLIYALDLADMDAIKDLVQKASPEIIVNTAAVSLPDWAEDHMEETYQANVVAVQNLVDICRESQIPLVHMSTDYVFSGQNPPYDEESEFDPVNYYGKTKSEAENIIRESRIDFLICRTTMLYGEKQPHQRPNPYIDWTEKLANGEGFDAPENHFTNPTFVEDLADCLVYLIEHDFRGIFHTAGSQSVSRYEFAMQLAEVFGYDTELVHPIPLPIKRAARPQNSTLAVEKLKNQTGIILKSPKEAFEFLKDRNDTKN